MEASSTCWTPANYFYKVIPSQWIREQSTTFQIYPTQAYQSLSTLSVRPQRKPWSTTCCIPTRHQSTHHRSLLFQTLVHAATYLHFFFNVCQCCSAMLPPRSLSDSSSSSPYLPKSAAAARIKDQQPHPISMQAFRRWWVFANVIGKLFSSNKRGCCFSTTVGFPHRPHQFSSIARSKVLQYLKDICLKHQEAQKVTLQPFQRPLA